MQHQDRASIDRRVHEQLPVPSEPAHRVHVVCCHFNPHGWRAPIQNYWRFRGALPPGTPLTTIEASYDGKFQIPGSIRIIATPRQVMWQKERLLRVAISMLPAEVDRVAWIDADVIFANKHVLEQADWLLDRYPVVQLFEEWYRTDAFGRPYGVQTACAATKVHGTQSTCPAPGGAWAARREVAERLFDLNVTGGGDYMLWKLWTGELAGWYFDQLSPQLHAAAMEESQHVWPLVRGRIGCVPGLAVHLFHGSRSDRRHVERRQILKETAYDPRRDIALAGNGLWQWTGRNRRLERYCRQLFTFRNEDG